MFVSIVLPLVALNSVEHLAFYGREAHAFFLSQVGRMDVALAADLHADQQRKAFTVSSVLSAAHSADSIPRIEKGKTYRVRVTCMKDNLSDLMIEKVLPDLPPKVRLGEAEFEIAKPVTDATMDAWAGCATSDALMSKWFGADAALTNRIDLEFASPTVFKRQGLMFVLPLPQLVWGSYLAAWNEFASPGFDLKALTTLENDVQISRYQLRTRAAKVRTVAQPSENASESAFKFGFVGRCAYTIFRPERALWRTLHLLADFSFFCGTGYKTTQGMGQTKKVKDEGRRMKTEG